MNGSSGVNDERRRRRHARSLTVSQSVFEWTAIVLLLSSSVGGMWLFGGVRVWLAAPLITLTLLGCALVAMRPLIFPASSVEGLPPGCGLILLALAWGAWSCFSGSTPYHGWIEWIQYFSLVAAYVAWKEIAAHQGRWRWILFLIIFSATLMSLYAIIQDVRGSRMVLTMERMASYGDRASGAYFCPNHFANILEMLFPVCLAMLLCRSAGFSLRLFSGYALIVMTPALYLTQSRSGWMATMAGLAVMLSAWAWRRSARRFVLTVLIAPVVMAVVGFGSYAALPFVKQRVDEALTGNMRIVLWKDTLQMIRDQPLIGHGLGSFRWRYPGWQLNFHEHLDPEFAHNEILHTLAETGIVGLALISVFALVVLARLAGNLRAAERDKDAFLVMGLFGAVAASAVHSAFDYNFHLYANNHLLFALLGLAAVGLAVKPAANPVPPSIARRWATAIITALVAMFLSAHVIRAAVANRLYRGGEKHRENFDFAGAESSYRRAIRWSPGYWRPLIGLGDLRARQSFWNRVPEDRLTQMEDALQFYRQAEKKNPWDLDAPYGASRVLKRRGDDAAVVAILEDIVRKAPTHAFYLVELGEALEKMGRDAEALSAYERSQAVVPSGMAAWRIGELRAKGTIPSG